MNFVVAHRAEHAQVFPDVLSRRTAFDVVYFERAFRTADKTIRERIRKLLKNFIRHPPLPLLHCHA